jgi:pre-rRNA-processing protein TSR3
VPPLRFLVIQDPKENRKKCTLTPLEGRDDVAFVRLRKPPARGSPGVVEIDEVSGILLELGAPVLHPEDRKVLAAGPVILLDATWARIPRLKARVAFRPEAVVERRSLPSWIATAYPRVSKVREDPAGGLASVEALFAASAILGQPRLELLDAYRWRDEFLERNGRLLVK